jgi:putative ABC transport system substrate-binding protein
MNNRRKLVIALGAGALATPLASFGQQQPKIFRIGILNPGLASAATARLERYGRALRDYSYVEGKNLAIEFRFADGKYERLPELAAELVRP